MIQLSKEITRLRVQTEDYQWTFFCNAHEKKPIDADIVGLRCVKECRLMSKTFRTEDVMVLVLLTGRDVVGVVDRT